MATEQIEEYLEAIGHQDERGERVTTSSLAHTLRVSAPSVTEMLRRLAERGLIDYHPRGEISLTETGRNLARSVMRRHRLWERFLHDVLGVKWDSVHVEACRLEHATSPLVESELARAIGDSATCPHGQAIPGPNGDIQREPSIPLLGLPPSQLGRVVSIEDEDPILLRTLEEAGVRPGEMVELSSLDLVGGKVLLRIGEVSVPVSVEVARAVRVASMASQERLETLPLGQLAPGQTAVVDRSNNGRNLAARCLALGITPGTTVTMIQNRKNGPLIIQVRDTRVALGRGEAQKIQVIRKDSMDGVNGASS